MLSLFVLFVLILIIAQISYSTKTDERVTRNEETLTAMDQAIESVLLQVYDDLLADAESSSAGGMGGAAGGEGVGGPPQGPTDSHEDEWAHPQRTEMNGLQVRVLIQDEDSKFNALSILTGDEVQAEKSFERLVRVIANARKGTDAEIDETDAREMATALQEYMKRRRDQVLPKPAQLSDPAEDSELGLPFTLREIRSSMPERFPRSLYEDFRDEEDRVVHSLASFLTVHSSLAAGTDAAAADEGGDSGGDPEDRGDDEGDEDDSGSEQGDEGEEGGAETPQAPSAPGGETPVADGRINVNTAPLGVLAGLFDSRDVPTRFWDEVLEYRNEPQEDEEGEAQDEELPLDEFGEPIVPKKVFASFDDLSQLDTWLQIEPAYRAEMRGLLKTHSSVFSIYVTARKPTGEERDFGTRRRDEIEREEAEGPALVRSVRSVVWRRQGAEGAEIVPILRWEVLDYVPYEVLDIPEGVR
jgi:hypothetical protein